MTRYPTRRSNPDLSAALASRPDSVWGAQSLGLDEDEVRAVRKARPPAMRDATAREIAELGKNAYGQAILSGRASLTGEDLPSMSHGVDDVHYRARLDALKRAVAHGWTVEVEGPVGGPGKMPYLLRKVADYASQRPAMKRAKDAKGTGDLVVHEGRRPWRVVAVRRPVDAPMRDMARRRASTSRAPSKGPFPFWSPRSNPAAAPAYEDHRIYVANLAAYNSGKLKGEWITPSVDADELREQIAEIVGRNNEWAIHGYEDFIDLGENPDLEQVARIANIYAGNEDVDAEAVVALMSAEPYYAKDVDEAIKYVEDYYQGVHDSEKDFAASLVEDLGMEGINNNETYFDVEAFGRDIRFDLDLEGEDAWAADMTDEQIGQHYIDELGWDGIGENARETYFDYDAFARDLFIDDYVGYDHDGKLYVFRRG